MDRDQSAKETGQSRDQGFSNFLEEQRDVGQKVARKVVMDV